MPFQKNICSGAIALFMMFVASGASAQSSNDLPWTGLYGGLHVGFGAADINHFDLFGAGTVLDHNVDGAVYGGQIGYNHQISNFVIGIEGEVSSSSVDGSAGAGVAARSFDLDVTYGVRARIGYVVEDALLYATAGVTFAKVDATTAFGADNDSHTGVVVGAGASWRLTDSISLGFEYLFADYDSQTYPIGGAPDNISFDTHTARATINFHLPSMCSYGSQTC